MNFLSIVSAAIIINTTTHLSNAFLFSRYDVNPNLFDLAKAQTGTLLNIGLEVKDPNSLSQLYVDGLSLELHCTSPPSKKKDDIVPLPGSSGNNPELSTGPLHLNIKSEGRFISIHGMQVMKVEKEAWEMVWVSGRPAGSLICGFHLPTELKRNDAILPSGCLFLNFRVFTEKGLHLLRNEKMMYERKMAEHLQKQKEALEMMNATDNPIKKAVHFREAAAANELLSLMYTERFEAIPNEDDDVLKIGDGLLVAKKGSLWTIISEPAFLGKKETNYYLGLATLKDLGK